MVSRKLVHFFLPFFFKELRHARMNDALSFTLDKSTKLPVVQRNSLRMHDIHAKPVEQMHHRSQSPVRHVLVIDCIESTLLEQVQEIVGFNNEYSSRGEGSFQ